MVAKVEWHAGELFPRVGFIVTNLRRYPHDVVAFYNGRGTTEQSRDCGKEGKQVPPSRDGGCLVRGLWITRCAFSSLPWPTIWPTSCGV